ncbi:MAG: sugar transferase [Armatimonadetes bacterium]|nr:sugar transferase [Armatimonadota bacterium]
MAQKRAVDIFGAVVGLLLLWPVALVVAALIKVGSPGPVLYRGRRVGRHGKPFYQLKFRTMRVGADAGSTGLSPDNDPRITRIGAFLRKFKVDELPQLWNVLVGEMSLVGPRPDVQRFVDMFPDEQRVILQVRPGITDWASLWNSDEGAVLATFDDPDAAYLELIHPKKLHLQMEYVRTMSAWSDLKIIFLTIARVFRRDRVEPDLAAMMAKMEDSAPPASKSQTTG